MWLNPYRFLYDRECRLVSMEIWSRQSVFDNYPDAGCWLRSDRLDEHWAEYYPEKRDAEGRLIPMYWKRTISKSDPNSHCFDLREDIQRPPEPDRRRLGPPRRHIHIPRIYACGWYAMFGLKCHPCDYEDND